MSKQEYHQLTNKHNKFSQEVADRINKDFPGTANASGGICWILKEYWDKCVAEVLEIQKVRKKDTKKK